MHYASSVAIKPSEDNIAESMEQQKSDEIEQQIRDYVNQMREKEQRALLQAMREKSLYAAADPRDYYETVNNEETPQKRAQSFVRFGKRAQTFVRFGKRAQTFVRFG
ncbi:hypothetical protein FO519_004218 [Halicephalobus sp. NKZ332]|nr:hypothetical protein FO519_004218 [Halicephalobus sp. NKZ332]